MIVHSKAIAELMELIASHASEKMAGQPFPLATWYFWLEMSLLSMCVRCHLHESARGCRVSPLLLLLAVVG
jgi:hypothetical protein